MSTVRLKWWQQEILDTTSTPNVAQKNVTAEEKPDLCKLKEFVDTLLQLEGPKVGVNYKIEVTGPLNIKDGTFWACPISSGFIQDKLEPMSKFMRSSIQADPNLRKVDRFDELVCVQSLENNLWMRGSVIKDTDNDSVKIQFVDVGRIEKHQKNELCKVPELFASIPYMAFHCTLFEDEVKVSFQDKWRFMDLVKKKLLNFTCEKIINQDNNNILYGQMETIIDKPIISINEQMKQCLVRNNTKSTDHQSESHNLEDMCNAIQINEQSKKVDSKTDKVIAVLTQVAGPILGNKYKIEVTSPLNADGTFWACPITSGFIRDKLEPMSDLLRSAIQADPGLRGTVNDFGQMLCVQSKENRLLMRAVVIRQVNNNSIKLQLIDMGRNEDHPKSKLFRVPEKLTAIPYMAFHCTLFEEKVKLSYEERWRFADLCKKKIVEFTFEKFIERDEKKLLIGKLETTDDLPNIMNVTEEVQRLMNSDKIDDD